MSLCMIIGLVIGILLISYLYNIRRNKKNINNKHVMITGGSSGIGKESAYYAVASGACVTLIARDENKLHDVKKGLDVACRNKNKDLDQAVQIFSLDVSENEESIKQIVDEAEKTFGPIYMLINCAGYSRGAKFEDLDVADLKKMLDVNIVGTFMVSREVVRRMKLSNTSGIVVMVSSLAGLFGLYGYTAYSAAKSALVKMAEALAMEVKPVGISVTVAVPPNTDTPGFHEENLTNPPETFLITEAGGLFSAKEVAKKMVDDALSGQFFSTVGLEGMMLTTLSGGTVPFTFVFDFIKQVVCMGIFRIIAVTYMYKFNKIIKNDHNNKQEKLNKIKNMAN